MPDAVTLVVLVLAAYRLTRLAGWDDFPLAVKIRARVIGQRWVVEPEILHVSEAELAEIRHVTVERQGVTVASQFPTPAMQWIGRSEDELVELPGKQPPTEADGVRPAYDRPTLAHLVHCPFCVGFWISLAVSAGWLVWHDLAYGMLPFAVSGAVGVIAKNLDP